MLALVGSCPLAAPSHLLRWLHALAQWVHVNIILSTILSHLNMNIGGSGQRVSIVQVGRIIDTRDITIAVAQQPISIYHVSASALLLCCSASFRCNIYWRRIEGVARE